MQKNGYKSALRGTRVVVFAGLFLAIAVLWQSLRFFVPWLTGPWNVFVIGSLVKATLGLALLVTRQRAVAGIAFLLPCVAFLQGQLPLLPLIPVVGCGSCVYALLVLQWWGTKKVWLAPCLSALIFYGGTQLVLACLAVPAPLAHALTVMFSWPQIITGCSGIILAGLLWKRLAQNNYRLL